MSQQIRTFIIRSGDTAAEEELNAFLRAHRVLQIDRHFAEGSWQFCVLWQVTNAALNKSSKPGKIDYREVLDVPTFALFARLRDLRKAISEAERLPAFAVFTNEQLAEIARMRCASKAELAKIEGVGNARIEKYGDRLLTVIQEHAQLQNQAGADSGSEQPA